MTQATWLFSKLLSAIFLPLTIFFVLNNTKGKKRMYVLIFYTILIIAGLFAASDLFDPIILIFLLPLTVGLFLKSLKGFHQGNSIQVLISGFLLIPPLLITFTEQTNEPYRLIPLVVFFAIGVSALLGKIKQDES